MAAHLEITADREAVNQSAEETTRMTDIAHLLVDATTRRPAEATTRHPAEVTDPLPADVTAVHLHVTTSVATVTTTRPLAATTELFFCQHRL